MNNEIKEIEREENGDFFDVLKSGIPALVLIFIGGGLLASNFLGIPFENWWVLFLLAPAILLLYQAWRDYKINGRLTNRSIDPLIGSFVLFSMLASFLFDVNWGQLWPVFLIFGGIAALLRKRSVEKGEEG